MLPEWGQVLLGGVGVPGAGGLVGWVPGGIWALKITLGPVFSNQVNTWSPGRGMGLGMLGSMGGVVRDCHF